MHFILIILIGWWFFGFKFIYGAELHHFHHAVITRRERSDLAYQYLNNLPNVASLLPKTALIDALKDTSMQNHYIFKLNSDTEFLVQEYNKKGQAGIEAMSLLGINYDMLDPFSTKTNVEDLKSTYIEQQNVKSNIANIKNFINVAPEYSDDITTILFNYVDNPKHYNENDIFTNIQDKIKQKSEDVEQKISIIEEQLTEELKIQDQELDWNKTKLMQLKKKIELDTSELNTLKDEIGSQLSHRNELQHQLIFKEQLLLKQEEALENNNTKLQGEIAGLQQDEKALEQFFNELAEEHQGIVPEDDADSLIQHAIRLENIPDQIKEKFAALQELESPIFTKLKQDQNNLVLAKEAIEFKISALDAQVVEYEKEIGQRYEAQQNIESNIKAIQAQKSSQELDFKKKISEEHNKIDLFKSQIELLKTISPQALVLEANAYTIAEVEINKLKQDIHLTNQLYEQKIDIGYNLATKNLQKLLDKKEKEKAFKLIKNHKIEADYESAMKKLQRLLDQNKKSADEPLKNPLDNNQKTLFDEFAELGVDENNFYEPIDELERLNLPLDQSNKDILLSYDKSDNFITLAPQITDPKKKQQDIIDQNIAQNKLRSEQERLNKERESLNRSNAIAKNKNQAIIKNSLAEPRELESGMPEVDIKSINIEKIILSSKGYIPNIKLKDIPQQESNDVSNTIKNLLSQNNQELKKISKSLHDDPDNDYIQQLQAQLQQQTISVQQGIEKLNNQNAQSKQRIVEQARAELQEENRQQNSNIRIIEIPQATFGEVKNKYVGEDEKQFSLVVLDSKNSYGKVDYNEDPKKELQNFINLEVNSDTNPCSGYIDQTKIEKEQMILMSTEVFQGSETEPMTNQSDTVVYINKSNLAYKTQDAGVEVKEVSSGLIKDKIQKNTQIDFVHLPDDRTEAGTIMLEKTMEGISVELGIEEQQGGQKNDSVAEALGEDPLEDPLAAFDDYFDKESDLSKKNSEGQTQQKTGNEEQGDANQKQTVEAATTTTEATSTTTHTAVEATATNSNTAVEATATNANTAVEATATNANTAVEAATTNTEAATTTDIEDDSVAPQSEPKKQKPKPVKTQTVAPKPKPVKTQIVNAPTPEPVTPTPEPVTPKPQPVDSFIEKQALKSAQSQIAIMALQRNNNNLDARMQLHASPAAASSDDAVSFELWTKGSFNSGSSKKDKVASFENVTYRDAAATIGLETKVNNVMLGVSYSRSVGTMDFSLAPKNEAKLELPLNTISNIYSIYGSALIMPNLYFSSAANLGQISFALAPDVSGAQKTAAAKLMSNAANTTKLGLLDLEGKFTYDLTLGNDISLRPTVGLGYTRVHNKDLEGSEAQLYNHARVVLGAAMSKDFYSGEVVITPKIHAGGAIVLGNEDNANNTAQSKQQLDASQALNLGNFFNVGASTSVKSKNGASFELGVDYTVNKQYDNYSGYMKIKLEL